MQFAHAIWIYDRSLRFFSRNAHRIARTAGADAPRVKIDATI
jgi:hypothetical protein